MRGQLRDIRLEQLEFKKKLYILPKMSIFFYLFDKETIYILLQQSTSTGCEQFPYGLRSNSEFSLNTKRKGFE